MRRRARARSSSRIERKIPWVLSFVFDFQFLYPSLQHFLRLFAVSVLYLILATLCFVLLQVTHVPIFHVNNFAVPAHTLHLFLSFLSSALNK